ncbi:MAG: DUF6089 family protein [Bacteroidota bacterium]
MKKGLLMILLIIGQTSYAQKLFVTMFIGASAYKGELQPNSLSFLQSSPAAGFGINYEISPRLYSKLEFNLGKISGNDKYNALTKSRNLSFQSDISEISLIVEYNLFDLYDYKVTPYFYMGAAFFKFTPFVDLANGSRVYLPEYDTEGQGFYLNRTKYKLSEWSIPFGGGLQWAVTKNMRIGLNIGIRKTNTDYLDDVSTTYVDKDLLFQNRGTNAVNFAYKGDLLPNGAPYPAAGTPRGNPKDKDLYYFGGASIRFRIDPKGKRKVIETGNIKSKVTCPANVQ